MSDDYTPAVLRHEKARQEQQRAASADRRAAALAEFCEVLGGQAEAAAALGISTAAVSKSLVAARRRAPAGPPLADYLELDLPNLGHRVPTAEEWEAEEDPEQRRETAERATATWRAMAYVLGTLQRETYAAGEYLAGAVLGLLDDEQLAERPALVEEGVVERDRAHASLMADVLADMARSLEERRRAAWVARDWWQGKVDELEGLADV